MTQNAGKNLHGIWKSRTHKMVRGGPRNRQGGPALVIESDEAVVNPTLRKNNSAKGEGTALGATARKSSASL